MDLRRLRYFVAVAEELHFGRAAERAHVVQSAISQQLKLLEDELGFTLIRRSRQDVSLTLLGEVFLPAAREILQRTEEAVRRLKASASGIVGRLSIGFVDNVLWTLLSPIIRDFRERWPHVDLKLIPMDRDVQVEAIAAGTVDIGIIPAPSHLAAAVKTEVLISAPLMVALPSANVLALRPKVEMAELAAEPFVTFPLQMNSRILDLLKTACAGAGFAPRVTQEGGQLHTLLSLVSAGLGVTLVPKWVAKLPQPGVVFRDLADFSTPYELLLAWKDDEPNPSAVTFREGHMMSCTWHSAARRAPAGSDLESRSRGH